MSSENESTFNEKKPRAPILSEKYSKFIQFGYYMMSKMTDTETFTKEDFLNQIQMFATVEQQQTCIQEFFDNQKENKKAMRKEIQNRNKITKPKKEKAPRKTKKTAAKAEVENTNDIDTNAAEENETTTSENIIENITNELIEEPMIDRINTAIEVAKDITSKKSRSKKDTTDEKKSRTKKKQTKEEKSSNDMESLTV